MAGRPTAGAESRQAGPQEAHRAAEGRGAVLTYPWQPQTPTGAARDAQRPKAQHGRGAAWKQPRTRTHLGGPAPARATAAGKRHQARQRPPSTKPPGPPTNEQHIAPGHSSKSTSRAGPAKEARRLIAGRGRPEAPRPPRAGRALGDRQRGGGRQPGQRMAARVGPPRTREANPVPPFPRLPRLPPRQPIGGGPAKEARRRLAALGPCGPRDAGPLCGQVAPGGAGSGRAGQGYVFVKLCFCARPLGP